MNLYSRLCNVNLLTRAWKSVYSGKSSEIRARSSGSDNVTLSEFNFSLQNDSVNPIIVLADDLKEMNFKFSPRKIVAIPKDDGSFRGLTVPTVRDRIVEKAILYLVMDSLYKNINHHVSYCGFKKNIFRKTKKIDNALNIRSAVRQIILSVKDRNFLIFETDIKKFFNNIDKKDIYNLVTKSLGADNSINHLIHQIIYYDVSNPSLIEAKKLPEHSTHKGLSQGSALSPLFASLYLKEFDDIMFSRFSKNYIRYVDDFIVMCSNELDLKDACELSVESLKNIKLDINLEKTHQRNLKKSESFVFLGLKFNRFKIEPKRHKSKYELWCKNKIESALDEVNRLRSRKLKYQIIKSKSEKAKIDIARKKKRRVLKFSSEIDILNKIVDGWVETFCYYHSDSCFKVLNSIFLNLLKKSDRKNFTKSLLRSTKPIITNERWKSLFKDT